MMNWAKLSNFDFHCKVYYNIFWPLSFSFNTDVKMKDLLLDNGLSITANDHTGTPMINFFNTEVDLGKSSLRLSGNLALWVIGIFANMFKLPLQILINMFFQPAVNFAINWVIIPLMLHNGMFEINTYVGKIKGAPLVVDLTLPEQPQFHDN